MKEKDMAKFKGVAHIKVGGHEVKVSVSVDMPEIQLSDNESENESKAFKMAKEAWLSWSEFKLEG
jgi:hypothetical protein